MYVNVHFDYSQMLQIILKRGVLNSVFSNDTPLSLVFYDAQISNYKFIFSKSEF